ncbi:MAG: helix-turn-helix domain-containing protein, partial [Pseudomonadales bacterium]|nr:helix-turn-helix domain-containing protein [Pseudomonadales bacterium]
LIGKPAQPLALEFDFAAPPEAAEFGYLFACPLLFDQPVNRICIPAELLRRPLVQNALSLSRFLRDSMAELIQGEPQEQDLASQIKVILSREYGQDTPGFDEVAQRMELPATTLRRRLREHGTSYRKIRDELRRDAACFYLRREDLSIEEIALMMGFSEASSFHRSFRKWTGSTPSVYRQQLLCSINSTQGSSH